MQFKIFISSVQREFAAERKLLADYIRKDAILCKFFDVFLFEEVPAQERAAAEVYLGEVDACDLYLGLLGESYGNVDAQGVSATEREYERAEQKHKDRICFVKQIEGTRDAREARFVSRVNPLLARGMFYRGYIEKVGSGTGDMLEKCRLAGTPEPEWIEEDDGFTVILKRQTSQVGLEDIPAAIQKTPRKPPENPQDTPQKIITAMRANPLITRNELAALVGLKPEGVKSAIAKLKASGAIRRVGPDKGGHWEVVAPSA